MSGNVQGDCALLKDNDIRTTLIDELNKINAKHDYRIVEELAVCDGEARVDVAVANGKLCGYEIKSDADTLERLPLQQKCYDKTFDMVSIVVGEKFKDKIEEYIPEYWGIYIVWEFKGEYRIRKKRNAKINMERRTYFVIEKGWSKRNIWEKQKNIAANNTGKIFFKTNKRLYTRNN